MASGTVANWLETNLNPKQEVVLLEDTSNGDIYTSRKFNDIQAATLSQNSPNSSGSCAVAFSGTSATIYSTTSGTFTLVLYGE